jgi:hypothetical protein
VKRVGTTRTPESEAAAAAAATIILEDPNFDRKLDAITADCHQYIESFAY